MYPIVFVQLTNVYHGDRTQVRIDQINEISEDRRDHTCWLRVSYMNYKVHVSETMDEVNEAMAQAWKQAGLKTNIDFVPESEPCA